MKIMRKRSLHIGNYYLKQNSCFFKGREIPVDELVSSQNVRNSTLPRTPSHWPESNAKKTPKPIHMIRMHSFDNLFPSVSRTCTVKIDNIQPPKMNSKVSKDSSKATSTNQPFKPFLPWVLRSAVSSSKVKHNFETGPKVLSPSSDLIPKCKNKTGGRLRKILKWKKSKKAKTSSASKKISEKKDVSLNMKERSLPWNLRNVTSNADVPISLLDSSSCSNGNQFSTKSNCGQNESHGLKSYRNIPPDGNYSSRILRSRTKSGEQVLEDLSSNPRLVAQNQPKPKKCSRTLLPDNKKTEELDKRGLRQRDVNILKACKVALNRICDNSKRSTSQDETNLISPTAKRFKETNLKPSQHEEPDLVKVSERTKEKPQSIKRKLCVELSDGQATPVKPAKRRLIDRKSNIAKENAIPTKPVEVLSKIHPNDVKINSESKPRVENVKGPKEGQKQKKRRLGPLQRKAAFREYLDQESKDNEDDFLAITPSRNTFIKNLKLPLLGDINLDKYDYVDENVVITPRSQFTMPSPVSVTATPVYSIPGSPNLCVPNMRLADSLGLKLKNLSQKESKSKKQKREKSKPGKWTTDMEKKIKKQIETLETWKDNDEMSSENEIEDEIDEFERQKIRM